MTLGLVLALAPVVPAAALLPETGADASHREASMDVDGTVLDARFADADGDGVNELWIAVRPEGSDRRELRVHRLTRDGVPARTPSRTVPLLGDVVAWGLADVRDEPGLEVLFFTRSGVWSLTPTRPELRGNVKPLLRANLVYDVGDVRALPFWDYVIDAERDLVVVPGEVAASVWGPDGDGGDEYVRVVDFARATRATRVGSRDDHGAVSKKHEANVTIGGSSVEVDYDETDPRRVLLDERASLRATLLSFERSYAAPAIGDVDGDGRSDVVLLGGDGLWVHLATADGFSAEPTRIEPRPAYLKGADRIDLVDLDGDGDDDVFYSASSDEEASGFAAEVYTLGALVNDGTRLLPAEPSQLLRFDAADLRYDVADVNGDGRPDLVVRKFELPSMLEVVASLDFKFSTLLYLGGGRGGRLFDRKPVMKSELTFDEDTVQAAIAARDLTRDLSGDGIADVAEVDANGRVTIRRLKHESSFFGGERWELETSPWKRFEARGSIGSLTVGDFNGDGVGDVLSLRSDGVLLLLSAGGGRR